MRKRMEELEYYRMLHKGKTEFGVENSAVLETRNNIPISRYILLFRKTIAIALLTVFSSTLPVGVCFPY